MRVLLLGINYAPEMISTGLCNTKLAEGLADRGHQVTVVTAQPYYPQWRTWPGYRGLKWKRATENGVDVVRCPMYVPSTPTGARRIVHYVSFALSSFVPLIHAALKMKPDYVVLVAPSIIASPAAWLAARLSGARAWLHVQDFEVGAAFATGLLDEKAFGARLAQRFERAMVSLFDIASSISPEMCRKLRDLGVPAARVHELRNWADMSRISPLRSPSPLRTEWAITAKHVALYSGNIGNKQGIEVILDAASLMRGRDDLVFLICGEGSYLEELKTRAVDLPNILFKPLQPVERLNDLLGLATVHLLPQKADAADLVLPSKLTNMLASGRPVVVTAAPGTGLAREVDGCGLVVPPEDGPALATAIEHLLDDPEFHGRSGTTARQYAEQRWSREPILDKLNDWLAQAVALPAVSPSFPNRSGRQ